MEMTQIKCSICSNQSNLWLGPSGVAQRFQKQNVQNPCTLLSVHLCATGDKCTFDFRLSITCLIIKHVVAIRFYYVMPKHFVQDISHLLDLLISTRRCKNKKTSLIFLEIELPLIAHLVSLFLKTLCCWVNCAIKVT